MKNNYVNELDICAIECFAFSLKQETWLEVGNMCYYQYGIDIQ